MARTARTEAVRFDPKIFLAKVGNGTTILKSAKKHMLFSQGDAANAVFYVQTGRVKLTVVSPQGKEAVVGILAPGAFFGEGCLAGQVVCMATATALDPADGETITLHSAYFHPRDLSSEISRCLDGLY